MYYFTITEIHNFKTAIKAPAEIINGGRSTYWALIFNWAWQPRLAFSFQAGLYGLRIPDSRVRLPSVVVIIQTISQLWSCGAAKRAALNAQFNAWLVLAPNARGVQMVGGASGAAGSGGCGGSGGIFATCW